MKTFEILDVHCHIYPERIAAKAVEAIDRFYGLEHSTHDGRTARLLEISESDPRFRFCIHSVATTPHQVRSINTFLAAEAAAHPDAFIGFGTLHPDSEDLAGDIEHLLSLGLRGVKLHPDIQKFAVDEERAMRIYALCRGRLPILLHTGDRRYDFSNPDRLLRILRAFPDQIFIGAHLGGFSVWEEAAGKLTDIENLYVDTSTVAGFIGAERAETYMKRYDPHRMLFGSDYPLWDPQKEAENLLSMSCFTEDDYENIFHKNAERILKI